MKRDTFITLLLHILLIAKSSQNEWPEDIDRCAYEDTECMRKIATDIIHEYYRGRGDLGLLRLDPIQVPSIVVEETSKSGLFNLDLHFMNVTIQGLSKAKVTKIVGFSEDPTSSTYEIYGLLPKIHVKGKYEAGVRMLNLSIQNQGIGNIFFENVKWTIKFKPKVIIKNERVFINIEEIKLISDPEKVKIDLHNIFNADKILGNNINRILNENWRFIWDNVKNSMNAGFAAVLKSRIEGIFKSFPYKSLFIDEKMV